MRLRLQRVLFQGVAAGGLLVVAAQAVPAQVVPEQAAPALQLARAQVRKAQDLHPAPVLAMHLHHPVHHLHRRRALHQQADLHPARAAAAQAGAARVGMSIINE